MSTKVYWVTKGRVPGLYRDWPSCQAQVNKFSGASFKSYASEEAYLEAKASLESQTNPSVTTIDTPASDLESTIVYTDGSCRTVNGKRAGGCGVWFGPNDERNISAPLPGEVQTNIRAEMYAIILAMQQHFLHKNSTKLVIKTDSEYVVLGMTEWVALWTSQNQWHGKKNVDLWKALIAARDNLVHGVEFTWVKGHAGIEGNEEADRLATAGAGSESRVAKKRGTKKIE